jgi:hypothetical protein
MHLPGSTYSKFHHFFADVFVLHQSGNIEVMLNGVAFIFTFDAGSNWPCSPFVGLGSVFMQ